MKASRRQTIESLGIFLAALLVIFLKMPTRITEGFLWAEDLSIFMKEAYEQGALSFQIPYAGYFHLIPRLVAYGCSLLFTPFGAPYFYVVSTALITAAGSTYIFHSIRRYLRLYEDPYSDAVPLENDLLALVAAFSFFLIPHQGEVFLNITNLQWILAPTMLVLLLDLFVFKENKPSLLLLKTGVLFLMAMTGPFCLLFSPIAALLMIRDIKKIKSLSFLLPAGAWITAAFIEIAPLLSQQTSMNYRAPINWWDKIIRDLVAQLFFVTPPSHLFIGKMAITLLPFLILIPLIKSSSRSLAPIILVITALELWCLSLWLRPLAPGITIPMGPCGYNARYYFVPAILLAWALIMSIKLLPLKDKILPSLLLSMMFLTGIIRFQAQKHPRWEITREGFAYNITAPCGWKTTIVPK